MGVGARSPALGRCFLGGPFGRAGSKSDRRFDGSDVAWRGRRDHRGRRGGTRRKSYPLSQAKRRRNSGAIGSIFPHASSSLHGSDHDVRRVGACSAKRAGTRDRFGIDAIFRCQGPPRGAVAPRKIPGLRRLSAACETLHPRSLLNYHGRLFLAGQPSRFRRFCSATTAQQFTISGKLARDSPVNFKSNLKRYEKDNS